MRKPVAAAVIAGPAGLLVASGSPSVDAGGQESAPFYGADSWHAMTSNCSW